jgi:hypothetical protein
MLASMKHNVSLTLASLLSILFATFHLADDISHGMFPGGVSSLPVVLVLAVWLYGALVLVERRSGHVIILVLSLLASGLPVIHMTGTSGITAGIAESAGAFFFAWTLLALGVTAVFSVILSARGLLQMMKHTPGAGK